MESAQLCVGTVCVTEGVGGDAPRDGFSRPAGPGEVYLEVGVKVACVLSGLPVRSF